MSIQEVFKCTPLPLVHHGLFQHKALVLRSARVERDRTSINRSDILHAVVFKEVSWPLGPESARALHIQLYYYKSATKPNGKLKSFF